MITQPNREEPMSTGSYNGGMSQDGATPFECVVHIRIDREMGEIIEYEAELMGDADFDVTIRRRLTSGLDLALSLGQKLLNWRPLHRDAPVHQVGLTQSAMEYLELMSDEFGYELDVLIKTLITDPGCKPMDVVSTEALRRVNTPNDFQAVKRVPGKGNIYPASFEMPGYQLVFLRMLAGRALDRAQIIEEALVALARQALVTGEVAGFRLTGEAHDMATRMVALAPSLMVIRDRQNSRFGGW